MRQLLTDKGSPLPTYLKKQWTEYGGLFFECMHLCVNFLKIFVACPGFKVASSVRNNDDEAKGQPLISDRVKYPQPGRDFDFRTRRPFFVPCVHKTNVNQEQPGVSVDGHFYENTEDLTRDDNQWCDYWAPFKFRLVQAYANHMVDDQLFSILAKHTPEYFPNLRALEGDFRQTNLELGDGPDEEKRLKQPYPLGCSGFRLRKDFCFNHMEGIFASLPVSSVDFDKNTKLPFIIPCYHLPQREEEELTGIEADIIYSQPRGSENIVVPGNTGTGCDPYALEKYLLLAAYAEGKITEHMWHFLVPTTKMEPWGLLTKDEWAEQCCTIVKAERPSEVDAASKTYHGHRRSNHPPGHVFNFKTLDMKFEQDIIQHQLEKRRKQIDIWWEYFPTVPRKKYLYMSRDCISFACPLLQVPQIISGILKAINDSGEKKLLEAIEAMIMDKSF